MNVINEFCALATERARRSVVKELLGALCIRPDGQRLHFARDVFRKPYMNHQRALWSF